MEFASFITYQTSVKHKMYGSVEINERSNF
jgi:hypothetical protein